MRLISKKTLPVLYYILRHSSFTQTEIHKDQQVSLGRINVVVNWLKAKGFISKERGRFHLIAPNSLAETIAAQVTIPHHRTYTICLDKNEAAARIQAHGTLCLHSALELHDATYAHESLHAYADEDLMRALDTVERGSTRVFLYSRPYTNVDTEEGATSAIQTIIDLTALQQGSLANNLRLTLWQTLQ